MTPRLIGINGFKRAGKGETGQAIFDYHKGVVYQIGFADKLKIMAARALGFNRSPQELIALMDSMKETAVFHVEYHEPDVSPSTEYDTTTLHDLSGREYLQNFGNDARQLFGDTFWIDQVLPTPVPEREDGTHEQDNILNLQALYPEIDVVAITDLRYPNEAQRVLDLGGEVWEVVRPGLVSDGHASEQPLPRELVSRTIENDGILDALRYKVYLILSEAGEAA
jgi:hypothetical protein